MTQTTDPQTAAPRDSGLNRLLTGRSTVDFIGRSRLWLIITVTSLALVAIVLAVRGLNFGIDFTGGSSFNVTGATREFSADDLRDALGEVGISSPIVQVVDGGEGALVSTPDIGEIGGEQQSRVLDAIAETTGVERTDIDVSAVGPRWGAQITRQSLRGLAVFLVLVVLYITMRFELRMAIAAVVTLLHDIAITVGIYALVGFEVTPASVIALLTILGYSLYDTVVVFDRVREDTAPLTSVSTATYGQTANRALNEVLVRSISTSITSILPVGSLLFIGASLLGATTLRDLALALFVGMAIGVYSSVIVATPLLVWIKEREPRWAELKERVESRRGVAGPQGTAGPPVAAAGPGSTVPASAATDTGAATGRRAPAGARREGPTRRPSGGGRSGKRRR